MKEYIDKELLKEVQTLIKKHLSKRETWNDNSSYYLKHLFERHTKNKYISNEAMKISMLACGYTPKDATAINWKFKYQITTPVPGGVQW